ncbi:MAG: PEP-CTERM sorting domain-containing protein [Planctomycetota bacterium]|nr:PEP-CTERM sorting domain-containing protein [Planctomycetota bacterium]
MKKFGFTTLLLGLVVVLMSSSVSKAVLLSDLIDNNGMIVNGDKKFTNFTWQGAAGHTIPASMLDVQPHTDLHGHLGIRISGGMFDLPGGGPTDLLVGFDVEVTDPGQWINDIHLLSNGSLNGGSGLFQITEQVLNPAWMQPVQLSVIDQDLPTGGITSLADGKDLPSPVKKLRVTKDIFLFATGSTSVVLSQIDQTFSQIPEPASMGLAVAGVLGMLAARRRS